MYMHPSLREVYIITYRYYHYYIVIVLFIILAFNWPGTSDGTDNSVPIIIKKKTKKPFEKLRISHVAIVIVLS